MKIRKLMDLPDECLELIFDQLGHEYHLDAISLVCKRFLSVSNNLKHSLLLCDPRILKHGNVSKLFQRFTQLKHICISCRIGSDMNLEEVNQFIIEIAKSGLNLEALAILHMPRISVEGLRELGSKMNNLKSLTLYYCLLSESDLIAIACSMPMLQQLDITYPYLFEGLWTISSTSETYVKDDGIEKLTSMLKNLRKFNIAGNNFLSDRSLGSLSSNCMLLEEFSSDSVRVTANSSSFALRNFSNLKVIDVRDYNVESLQSPGLLTIENSLSYAKSLCSLRFWKSNLSDTLLGSIAKAHLPLKSLALCFTTNITISGLSLLLREYQSLDRLTLRGAPFLTDQDMHILSKFLPKLTFIFIDDCSQLTSSTFFILARSCPLLGGIVMRRTSLGREDHCFLANIKKTTQVRYLDLSHNDFLNDESLKEIGSVCPNLRVIDISNCRNILRDGIGEILKKCVDIRCLKVNESQIDMILGEDSEESKLKIDELEVASSEINYKGMTAIGMRCPALLKLNLMKCSNVTAEGVKEVVKKCAKLMVIDLRECPDIGFDVLQWMVKTRPSLRKIISPHPSLVTVDMCNLIMDYGCRLCSS